MSAVKIGKAQMRLHPETFIGQYVKIRIFYGRHYNEKEYVSDCSGCRHSGRLL